MLKQVQENLDKYSEIADNTKPRAGWINVIREALGISSRTLASIMGCSQTNIIAMERRERLGTITLNTLEQVAQSMNCRLVYAIVPLKPLEQLLEDQARKVAKKQIKFINHSMRLEQQELDNKQLKQQEDNLVGQLLKGSRKKLWEQ